MGDVRFRRNRSGIERLEQRDPANGSRKHRGIQSGLSIMAMLVIITSNVLGRSEWIAHRLKGVVHRRLTNAD